MAGRPRLAAIFLGEKKSSGRTRPPSLSTAAAHLARAVRPRSWGLNGDGRRPALCAVQPQEIKRARLKILHTEHKRRAHQPAPSPASLQPLSLSSHLHTRPIAAVSPLVTACCAYDRSAADAVLEHLVYPTTFAPPSMSAMATTSR